MASLTQSFADMSVEGIQEGKPMPTVLLIEDDAAVRRVLRQMLAAQGHRVIEAGCASEAIGAARCADPIDLVVTDVVMPQSDCGSLVDQLRQARPELKVLLISGYSEEVLAEYGVDVRSQSNFLQKPFGAAELAGKIREVLTSSKSRCHGQAA